MKSILPTGLAMLVAFIVSCARNEPTQSQDASISQNGAPAQTIAGVRIWKNIAYVSAGHKRQKLDFYAPSSSAGPGPWPCIIFIHGGGWEAGSKSGNAFQGLCWQGFAVASIDYRFSSEAPFPAQIEDCKAAVRFLRANATRFNIAPKRIGAGGQSAGGHLAALLGTTGYVPAFDVGENLTQSSRIEAVCDLFGPTNLAFYGSSRPGDTLSRFMGGTIQSSAAQVQAANPMAYVTKDDAPFLIFHGDSDPLVPQRHSEALRDALQTAGVPVSLTIVKGAGHGFSPGVTKAIDQEAASFFKKYLQ